MTTTPSPDRPLRADAERNRQRILAAASAVFAERGLDVSLDDIAAAAGVGVGTVYRRFPDKDALIDALFHEKIDDVVAHASHCLAIEDPWDGFAAFMVGLCERQAQDRGLKETLHSQAHGRQRVADARDRIAPIARQIVTRAQAAGVLRDDIGPFDVPMMSFSVGFIAERTRDVSPEVWRRMLTVFLDGLRPERAGTTPMPVDGLTPSEFTTAMSRRHC